MNIYLYYLDVFLVIDNLCTRFIDFNTKLNLEIKI